MPAIKIHHTDTAEGAWDGPGNVARLRSGESRAYYARVFAWQDLDADETTKGAYKFPHHEVNADGDPGAANVRGCQTGIAVLNGSMGGADIPDGDRQGVYAHLAAHLEDADVEPAELKSGRHRGQVMVNETGIELRFVNAELRVVDVDGAARIEGYAAVFNQWSDDLGWFRELIRPGAFAKTIQEADVRALWQHDSRYVLGRMASGTLRLAEHETGLYYEAEPPDAQWAQDALVTMRRGDVSQSSFAFEAVRDVWSQDEDGIVTRELVEVRLYDVSPVTFPAYPQTSVAVRAKVSELWRKASAPGQEPHPDGDDSQDGSTRARLDIRRRQLELIEIEM